MTKQKKILLNMWLSFFTLVMIYPLLWMFFASFKTNQEIFASASLLPESFSLDSFITGWRSTGRVTYATFFLNTFKLVIPSVIFTVISSVLVAYGFARFRFPFKKQLFAIMLATLMLPHTVIMIPRYMIFRNLGWLDTYLPFYIPALFATYPFFTFMLVQFFRSIPKELDEAAKIDGCNSFKTLVLILLPTLKPALFSVAIFQFVWMWSDFLNPLIYLSSVNNYPVSLALRMSLDTAAAVDWSPIMAVSTLSVIPPMLVFFFSQKYFVEGISNSGLKG